VTPPPSQPAVGELRLVDVLHALSDPARLEIVRRLGDGHEHACSAFHGLGGISVPTLSHHLKVLREAGLTDTRVDGKHRFITLRSDDAEARFPGLLHSVIEAAGRP
jgi:DNA-binding transcriptional ArsR family regulator